MPTSRVPALITWLISNFTGSPLLGLAVPPVSVYDGTVTSDAGDKLILWVGFTDPASTSPEPAATWQQARDDLGGKSKIETSVVKCAAEAWSGTDDAASVRASVFAVVDAANAVVRADTTQFGGLQTLADPGVTAGELIQDNTQQGAVARVVFEISFKSFT